ncbi:MAG: hypothetical protein HRU28_04765 [Rhizobiales bacterium]|nr:hypothetical protein [Hyphomicrobiales bacterium]
MFSSVFKFLDKFSIKWQVLLIAAFSLIATLALGSISLFSASKVAVSANYSVKNSQLSAAMHILAEETLLMRRHEKDYLLRLTPKYEERYLKQTDKTINYADGIADIIHSSELDQIKLISTNIRLHKQKFIEVVDLSNKMGIKVSEGLIGNLLDAAYKIESKLKSVLKTDIHKHMNSLLIVRSHEKYFLLHKIDRSLMNFKIGIS